MATYNRGIVHYAPNRRVFCGRANAICGVATVEAFDREPKQCKRCAEKLAKARAVKARREADALRACTGAVEVTVREEIRLADGTLRIVSEETSRRKASEHERMALHAAYRDRGECTLESCCPVCREGMGQ